LIDEHLRTLSYSIGPEGMHDYLKVDTFEKLYDGLSDCELRRTLEWMQAILSVRYANTREKYDQALADLAEIRSKLPRTMREVTAIVMAYELYKMKNYNAAREELRSGLPGVGYHKHRLLSLIRATEAEELQKANHSAPPSAF
jgi:hypothetical protein